jgi:roadblock/LC7 domain-containing protein
MRDGTWYVVLNGAESEPFETVTPGSITFSPDGNRLAYVARRDGRTFVVADATPGAGYDAIADGSLTFSPDGSRLAYAARRGDAEVVVVEGNEGKAYETVGRPHFSRDGRRLAHAAHAGARSFLVADGNEVLAFEGGDAVHDLGIAFSPDGSRVACVVGPEGRMRAVVDGAEGKAYAQVFEGSVAFSPDGRRVAYMATRTGKGPAAVTVVDGKDGKPHDGVVPGTVRFSPDGRRVAYVAEKLDVDGAVRRCAVVDGVEGKPYDWVRHAPVFSPDGRHVAYVAERRMRVTRAADVAPAVPAGEVVGFESVVVVDGTEAGPYPWVRGDLLFTPDSGRVAYVAAAADDRFADAGEIPADPTNPSAGGRLVFDKAPRAVVPTAFRYNQPDPTKRPVKILVVEEQIGTE